MKSEVMLSAAPDSVSPSEGLLFELGRARTLMMSGSDVFPLLQRLSTNDVDLLAPGDACPTLFLNAQGRLLERVIVQRLGDEAHLHLQPGRNELLLPYLQRNIFFRDDVSIQIGEEQLWFELFGPRAREALTAIEATGLGIRMIGVDPEQADACSFLGEAAVDSRVMAALRSIFPGIRTGKEEEYEYWRIQRGRPVIGHELTPAYLPLELGLWDEINFAKGCYVGQEIIARMESRQQLARLLVCLTLTDAAPPGSKLSYGGKRAGEITSSAPSPDGGWRALAIVKRVIARHGKELAVADTTALAQVQAIAGRQPPWVISHFYDV